MKGFTKKIAIFAMLVLFVQTAMFSAEMSLLELNKEVLTLKYELYQMENKLGEYEDMSDFKMFFEKAKKESLLRKREAELTKRNAENAAAAKEAFDQAVKEFSEKTQGLKEKGKAFTEKSKELGKEIGDAVNNFLNSLQ